MRGFASDLSKISRYRRATEKYFQQFWGTSESPHVIKVIDGEHIAIVSTEIIWFVVL